MVFLVLNNHFNYSFVHIVNYYWIVNLFLITALTLSCLAGCGSSEPAEKENASEVETQQTEETSTETEVVEPAVETTEEVVETVVETEATVEETTTEVVEEAVAEVVAE